MDKERVPSLGLCPAQKVQLKDSTSPAPPTYSASPTSSESSEPSTSSSGLSEESRNAFYKRPYFILYDSQGDKSLNLTLRQYKMYAKSVRKDMVFFKEPFLEGSAMGENFEVISSDYLLRMATISEEMTNFAITIDKMMAKHSETMMPHFQKKYNRYLHDVHEYRMATYPFWNRVYSYDRTYGPKTMYLEYLLDSSEKVFSEMRELQDNYGEEVEVKDAMADVKALNEEVRAFMSKEEGFMLEMKTIRKELANYRKCDLKLKFAMKFLTRKMKAYEEKCESE